MHITSPYGSEVHWNECCTGEFQEKSEDRMKLTKSQQGSGPTTDQQDNVVFVKDVLEGSYVEPNGGVQVVRSPFSLSSLKLAQ